MFPQHLSDAFPSKTRLKQKDIEDSAFNTHSNPF